MKIQKTAALYRGMAGSGIERGTTMKNLNHIDEVRNTGEIGALYGVGRDAAAVLIIEKKNQKIQEKPDGKQQKRWYSGRGSVYEAIAT